MANITASTKARLEREGDGVVVLDVNTYNATLRMSLPSEEQAREVAALFPKSYRVRGGRVSNPLREGDRGDYGYVDVHAVVKADGANGGRNESGIARIVKAVAKFEAAGFPVVYRAGYTNSLPMAEALEFLGL